MKGGKRQAARGQARIRRVSVRGTHRQQVDVNKLARAIIALAQADAEAAAQAEHAAKQEEGGARD